MTWSPSDTIDFLGHIPRWVWIILFVATIFLRVSVLITLAGFGIVIIFALLWVLGIIAFAESVDDDGPGHKGNKPGLLAWLQR